MPRSGVVGSESNSVFNLLRPSTLFSIVAAPIYILANRAQEFPFLHILTNICISCLFDDGHCNKCEVISHCFCISPVTNDVEHLFMYLLAYLYAFFGKMFMRSSAHFYIRFLVGFFCCCSLYILNVNFLSDIWFVWRVLRDMLRLRV